MNHSYRPLRPDEIRDRLGGANDCECVSCQLARDFVASSVRSVDAEILGRKSSLTTEDVLRARESLGDPPLEREVRGRLVTLAKLRSLRPDKPRAVGGLGFDWSGLRLVEDEEIPEGVVRVCDDDGRPLWDARI